MNEEILTLYEEDGTEVNFKVLDLLEYEGEEYVVLYPADGGEDEPVHILRVTSEDMDNGEQQYEGIADEELIETLYQMFCKRNGV